MNDWDKDNLDFILTANKSELAEFYDQCNLEDLQYLSRLVTHELSRLHLMLAEQFDDIESVNEANTILNKIKAK